MPATKNPHPAAAVSRIAAGQRSRGTLMPSPAHDHHPATARRRSPPRKRAASPAFVLTIAGTDTVVSFPSGVGPVAEVVGGLVGDLGASLGADPLERFADRQPSLAGDPADLLELRRHRDRLPVEARDLEGDRAQRGGGAGPPPPAPAPARTP